MRHSQILHDVGVADLAEEAALLFEQGAVSGPAGVHKDGVEEFGCTGQLAERGLTHLAERSRAAITYTHKVFPPSWPVSRSISSRSDDERLENAPVDRISRCRAGTRGY